MPTVDRATAISRAPKKRSGVAALVFDGAGRILLVKPTYKEGWVLPGGALEDNESPAEGCARELYEETGLVVQRLRFLCLDYQRTEEGDSFQFVFDAGTLNEAQAGTVRLPREELNDWQFAEPQALASLGRPRQAVRISRCLEALSQGKVIYLENGEAR